MRTPLALTQPHTIPGVVITYVLLPLVVAGITGFSGVLWWLGRRQIATNDEFRDALSETSKALALLVQQSSTDRDTLTNKHNELAVSVALLADRTNEHIRWADRERLEVREGLRDAQRNQITGGTP